MSTILTTKFRIHNAKSFKEGFDEGTAITGATTVNNQTVDLKDVGISTNIYTTIGKVTEWDSTIDINSGANNPDKNDSNPPNPIDHLQSDYEVWRNMISAKKVLPSDVSHAIPRFDWDGGTVYGIYDDTASALYNGNNGKPFYVITSELNVYKCIWNNYNSASTVEPTEVLTSGNFETTDKYVWKYMYTISASDAFKFYTPNYIPVDVILSDPGDGCSSIGNQYQVQQNSVDGSIDVVYRQSFVDSGVTYDGRGSSYINYSGQLSQEPVISNDGLNSNFPISGIQFDSLDSGDLVGASIFFPEHNKVYEISDSSNTLITVSGTTAYDEMVNNFSKELTLVVDSIANNPNSAPPFDIGDQVRIYESSVTQQQAIDDNSNSLSGQVATISNFISTGTTGYTLKFVSYPNELQDFSAGNIVKNITSGERENIVSSIQSSEEKKTEIKVLPTVVVEGDGSDFSAIPIMAETGSGIQHIQILNSGKNYSYANVSFKRANMNKGIGGLDANFKSIISPRGGHGSNAIDELGGFFIIINTKFEYDEGQSNLPTSNDFRQISLIKDPKLYNSSTLATSTIYNQMKTLVFGQDASYAVDSIVYIGNDLDSSTARARVVDVKTDGNNKNVRISNIIGTFNVGESVKSDRNGSTGYNLSNILDESLEPYSGEVLFIEQRRPIQRDDSQIEDIKIVLEF